MMGGRRPFGEGQKTNIYIIISPKHK
jgi:hypothetical protein